MSYPNEAGRLKYGIARNELQNLMRDWDVYSQDEMCDVWVFNNLFTKYYITVNYELKNDEKVLFTASARVQLIFFDNWGARQRNFGFFSESTAK